MRLDEVQDGCGFRVFGLTAIRNKNHEAAHFVVPSQSELVVREERVLVLDPNVEVRSGEQIVDLKNETEGREVQAHVHWVSEIHGIETNRQQNQGHVHDNLKPEEQADGKYDLV